MIRGFHDSGRYGGYNLSGLGAVGSGFSEDRVYCDLGGLGDRVQAPYGDSLVGNQRIRRAARGGRHVAAGGGNAGNYPSDGCLRDVSQIATSCHDAFYRAFYRRRCGFRSV